MLLDFQFSFSFSSVNDFPDETEGEHYNEHYGKSVEDAASHERVDGEQAVRVYSSV